MTKTNVVANSIIALTIVGLTLGAGASLAFAQEIDQQGGLFGEKHKKGFRAFGQKMRGLSNESKAQLKELREETRERIQNATTDEEKEAIRAEVKAQHESLRAQFKAEREANRENRPERERDGDIGNRVERIMKRLNNGAEHLTNLGERIQNFLNEKRAQGVDTTTAQNELNEANTELGEAKAAIVAAQAVIDRVLATDLTASNAQAGTPSDHKDEVKAAIRNAVSEIKEAHKAMREAVRAAKVLN